MSVGKEKTNLGRRVHISREFHRRKQQWQLHYHKNRYSLNLVENEDKKIIKIALQKMEYAFFFLEEHLVPQKRN